MENIVNLSKTKINEKQLLLLNAHKRELLFKVIVIGDFGVGMYKIIF